MRLTSCSYLTALRPSAVATSAKCEVSWRDWCCPSLGQPVHRACASRPCSTATIPGEWWSLELGTQSSHQGSSLTGAGSPEAPRTGFGEPRPLCPEPGPPLETEAGISHTSRLGSCQRQHCVFRSGDGECSLPSTPSLPDSPCFSLLMPLDSPLPQGLPVWPTATSLQPDPSSHNYLINQTSCSPRQGAPRAPATGRTQRGTRGAC